LSSRSSTYTVVRGGRGNTAKLYLQDCVSGMKQHLKASSVNVVVTSPPYNIGIRYSTHRDELPREDYLRWMGDVAVCVKVPINCIGVADCAGIKLGGFLRQVIRHVKVECLPKKIPEEFQVDIKDLGIRQSKRLSDISMPEGVKPLANLEEVVVVIAKRQ